MQGFGAFVFGFVLGGVVVFTSLSYHIVHTEKGIQLVPKLSATFAETYVDVRKFTATDWANHKTLVAAIIRAEKQEILQDSAAREVHQGMETMMRELGLLGQGK